MTPQELRIATEDVVNKLLRSRSTRVTLSDIPFEVRNTINLEDFYKDKIQTRTLEVPDGERFYIPRKFSSWPYIRDITDDGKVVVQTRDLMSFKLKKSKRIRHPDLFSSYTSDFHAELHRLNQVLFPNGIDFDNFVVSNISHRPVSRDVVKNILRYGAIVPLNSKRGVFVPNFALVPNYFSYEYESRWINIPTSDRALRDHIVKLVKRQSGINIQSLLPYRFSESTASFRSYMDGSVQSQGRRFIRELVVGSAPLSNMILATNLMFNAIHSNGLIYRDDLVMDKSAGMHISTTVPNAITDSDSISSYLNHFGLIFDALLRTAPRRQSTSYLGVTNNYVSNRYDFRLLPSSNRLEMRYPGPVADPDYIANQLIMASKLTSDVIAFSASAGHRVGRQNILSAGNVVKLAKSPTSIINAIKSPRDTEIKRWFNSFMEMLGINDDFSKKFVLNFMDRCSRTQ